MPVCGVVRCCALPRCVRVCAPQTRHPRCVSYRKGARQSVLPVAMLAAAATTGGGTQAQPRPARGVATAVALLAVYFAVDLVRSRSGGDTTQGVYLAAQCVAVLACALAAGAACTPARIQGALPWVLAALCATAILIDAEHAVRGAARAWPAHAPILQLSCLQLSGHHTVLLATAAALCTMAIDFDLALRFGLLDENSFMLLPPYSARGDRAECAWPPCATSLGSGVASVVLMLAVLASSSTARGRSRADAVPQHDAAAWQDLRKVVAYLTAFRLESAVDALVECDEVLPKDVAAGLRDLVDALYTYKPHLPPSCFSFMDEETEEDILVAVSPPILNTSQHSASDLSEGPSIISVPTPVAKNSRGTRTIISATDDSQSTHSLQSYFPMTPNDVSMNSAPGGAVVPAIPIEPLLGPATSMAGPGGTLRRHESRTSCHDLSAKAAPTPRVLGLLSKDLLRTHLSLVTVNITDSLAMIKSNIVNFALLHTEYVRTALDTFMECRGVVDLFVGDRVYVSFNASRPCPLHAVSAVRAAKLFTRRFKQDLHTVAAVSTGKAVCGNLGCEEYLRFNVLGKLPLTHQAMLQQARGWGVRVLCNEGVRVQAEMMFDMRLLLKNIILTHRGVDGRATHFYEVLVDDGAAANMSETEHAEGVEWMYEMERLWVRFNEAGRFFLRGANRATVMEHVQECPQDVIVHMREQLDGGFAAVAPLRINY